MEIYYAFPSIYARKALAVLAEKDLDYEVKKMEYEDLGKPEYLKLNPNGEVPTLVDDGQVIYESTAIIEYLDEEYPEPPLMPAGSYDRAKVRIIEEFCDLHLYPAVRKYYIKSVIEKAPSAELKEIKAAVSEHLKRIESYLGKQEFLVGNFSLADCALMPVVSSLEALKLNDLLPKDLIAYAERLKTRPGYKAATA